MSQTWRSHPLNEQEKRLDPMLTVLTYVLAFASFLALGAAILLIAYAAYHLQATIGRRYRFGAMLVTAGLAVLSNQSWRDRVEPRDMDEIRALSHRVRLALALIVVPLLLSALLVWL